MIVGIVLIVTNVLVAILQGLSWFTVAGVGCGAVVVGMELQKRLSL
jgi:hypothetical protein